MTIIYGGGEETVRKQLACDHDWHGPCVDKISRYSKCRACFVLNRDCSESEYYSRLTDASQAKAGFAERVLRYFAEHDLDGYLWWDDGLDFFIHCSDVFAWGVSDSEPLLESSFDELVQAVDDCSPHEDDGVLLYVARRRGMRPQGAFYKELEESNYPLFDDCGEPRPATFGNPVARI